MKCEWEECTLDTIMTFKNGKARPPQTGQFPVYGGNGVLSSANQYNSENCIVIGRVGVYCGSVYFEKGKCWISDNAICGIPKGKNDAEYLYYLLCSLKLNKRRIGTSQPLLTQEILRKIGVIIPPENQQKKISRVLRCLDDEIELNNAINNNLEKQAQALFDDFFINREEVPADWRKGSLLDIADYLNGLAMQKYRPVAGEDGIPVLKIKELRQGICDSNSELCSSGIKPEYIVSDGDVIFSWSGSLLVDFWCGGTCGLNQHLFKVTSSKYDKWFYYSWTKHHLAKFVAFASAMATTMGHIKRGELAKAEVLIPNEADYNRIGALLQPIYDLIIANRIENKRLTEARDALLPKLMNGKIAL